MAHALIAAVDGMGGKSLMRSQGEPQGGVWMNAGEWNGGVWLGERLLAMYAYAPNGTQPVYFTHANALDSTTMATDATGAPAGEILYYPWGALWGDTTNGTLFRFFASLEWYDPPVDGYQTSFRNLIPRFGRWLSPDPLGGDISNPQSLNRYAYAVNNPTSLVDPLGLDPCDSQDYSEPCDPCGDAFWQLLDIGCMPVGPGAPAPFPPIPPGGSQDRLRPPQRLRSRPRPWHRTPQPNPRQCPQRFR